MTSCALTVVSAVFCGVLIAAEYFTLAKLRIAAKIIASAAFVVLAAPAAHHGAFGHWVFAGLVLGAIGDVALLGRSKTAFLAGLVAFLFGHLAYIFAIAELEAPGRWFADAGLLAAVPIAVGLVVLAMLWSRLGSLRIPVIGYVVAIDAMVIAAFAAYRADALADPQKTWLAVGAALFFLSDISVARERFVGRTFANKLWGLPAYYAAQLLIAWTAISFS
ncbi:MAG: lysoplasmalogenase [Kofleriaceae bacterium]